MIGRRYSWDTSRRPAERTLGEQANSGQTARMFCQARGVGEHSFYMWRQRLRSGKDAGSKKKPVRFALVDRGQTGAAELVEASLELLLASGERLRIQRGVDAETLRIVLEALRS